MSESGNTERGTVALIGTSHVSAESSVHVRSAIRRHNPDVVAVELGPTRARHLQNPGESNSPASQLLEVLDTTRETSPLAGAVHLALTTMSEVHDSPADGGDMVVGARTAAAHGTPVAVVDRGVQDTMTALADGIREDTHSGLTDLRAEYTELADLARDRRWTALTRRVLANFRQNGVTAVKQYAALAYHATQMGPDTTPQPDTIRDVMDVAMADAPETKNALLHSRDRYLAGRLQSLREQGLDVVAVLGAAHVPGVRDHLQEPSTLPSEDVTAPETLTPEDIQDLI